VGRERNGVGGGESDKRGVDLRGGGRGERNSKIVLVSKVSVSSLHI